MDDLVIFLEAFHCSHFFAEGWVCSWNGMSTSRRATQKPSCSLRRKFARWWVLSSKSTPFGCRTKKLNFSGSIFSSDGTVIPIGVCLCDSRLLLAVLCALACSFDFFGVCGGGSAARLCFVINRQGALHQISQSDFCCL